MEFANKTQLGFDPLPEAVAVDATGTPVYTTPADLRPRLGDLARLRYQHGEFRYVLTLNQSTAGGSGTVKLTDGATVIASEAVDLSTGTRHTGSLEVDLADVAGGSRLRLELDIDAAADAGTTAQLAAALEVTHPIIVQAGCGD